MKKRYVIGATFLAASLGAVGVSAGNTLGLLGSDTLFDLTNLVLNNCPGAGPGTNYTGTGSGNGQNAMRDGLQQVAPMSRFLNNGACTGAAPAADSGTDARSPASQAEGIVIGLDGVSIVGWNRTFAADAAAGDAGSLDAGDPTAVCNGLANTTCASGDPLGLAHTTTVTCNGTCSTNLTADGSSYTFNGWRDVLRVLLAGFDHSTTASGTNAAAWAARDCNSNIRQAIANHYGSFFENNCVSPAGSNATPAAAADSVTGHCAIIRHVFRRDDFSGTTDTVVGLLGLPSIVNPSAALGTGATPFCNAIRPANVYPTSGTVVIAGVTVTMPPTCPVGSDATYDPTVCVGVSGGACTAANVALWACTDPVSGKVKEKAVYRATMQDNDPIRRPCANNEQICSHSKTLGLVVTMNEANLPNTTAGHLARYQATLPAANTFAATTGPDIFDPMTSITTHRKVLPAQGALCPNGDVVGSGCIVPAIPNPAAPPPNSPQVLARTPNSPLLVVNTVSVPLAAPSPPGLAEGRQYNQHLYNADGTYITSPFKVTGSGMGVAPNGLPLTGAYYRIHATTSLNANGRTCQFDDMTDQIGCLVEASPCSVGYAGRSAASLTTNANTDAVKINGQSPEPKCIQGDTATNVPGFKYPLSRKLYLNSTVGFPSVTGQELQLAGCETDLAQSAPLGSTPAGIMSTQILAAGFLQVGAINGGEPYCEDFNENMLCPPTASNTNACNAPHGNFTAWPGITASSNTTICGDGVVQAYEDCDCGTAATPGADTAFCTGNQINGQAGGKCSTTCRFTQ